MAGRCRRAKNTVLLSDTEPDVRSKLKTMVTDPARVHRSDPGNPARTIRDAFPNNAIPSTRFNAVSAFFTKNLYPDPTGPGFIRARMVVGTVAAPPGLELV